MTNTNDYASRQTKSPRCLHLTGSLVGPGDMLIILKWQLRARDNDSSVCVMKWEPCAQVKMAGQGKRKENVVKVVIREESIRIYMSGPSLKAPGDTSNSKYTEFLLGSKGCMKFEQIFRHGALLSFTYRLTHIVKNWKMPFSKLDSGQTAYK